MDPTLDVMLAIVDDPHTTLVSIKIRETDVTPVKSARSNQRGHSQLFFRCRGDGKLERSDSEALFASNS